MGKDEAGQYPSDPQFRELLTQFSAMKAPDAFPQGKYRGRFLKIYGNPVLFAMIATLSFTADFRGSECSCTNPIWISWMLSNEKGTMSFIESSYDGKPCLRIDFRSKFFETRMRSETELVSIVTSKETREVSEVNVLTLQQ